MVLVTVEYDVPPEQGPAFLAALHEYGRIRRRDGAREWGIFQDVEKPDRYLETFILPSWLEHLRQHERLTQADREIVEVVAGFVTKPIEVRHFVSADT